MSLDQYDGSLEDGRPVYLYEFSLQVGASEQTLYWRYASCAMDVDTTWTGPKHWQAGAISHDAIKQTGEATVDALTIEASISIAPAQVYLTSPPTTPIMLRIFQKDVSDDELWSVYAGEISQVNVPDIGRVVITCETVGVSMARMGLRAGWQRACPHTLYGPLCKLDKASHGMAGSIVDVFGISVMLDFTTPILNFGGGILEYTHPLKGLQSLMIESQPSLDTFEIFSDVTELKPGMSVTIYPGCSHTPHDCKAFGNYPNYGGVPSLPGKSPFDGNNPFF